MTNQIIPFQFESSQVRVVHGNEGEPLFVAKDVMLALGYADVSNITKSIAHVPDEWKGREPIPTPGGIQQMAVLTEQGLYFFLGRSDKPKALPFQKWLAGDVVPSIRKTGRYDLMPDFTDPVAAARAWADAYEAKQLAQAKVLQLEQQIEEDRPYTEIAKLMTGDTTMFVRDWIAKMKQEHGNFIKEKKVREFLHDQGYWYWTQTSPRETRAYAKFDHLFKLEPERVNGILRDVLKITGQGVLELTPIVVEHFKK